MNNAQKQPSKENASLAKRYAMPVGTQLVLEESRFIPEQRDVECSKCNKGLTCILSQEVNGKRLPVKVFCTCVPYIRQEDPEGNQEVMFKGRGEKWFKGKRSEAATQQEILRKQAAVAALKYRDEVTAAGAVNLENKMNMVDKAAEKFRATGLSVEELQSIEKSTKVETKPLLVRNAQGRIQVVRKQTLSEELNPSIQTPAPAVQEGNSSPAPKVTARRGRKPKSVREANIDLNN